jgi:Acetyltransferases, including N-acetylases of ribosomal proteins
VKFITERLILRPFTTEDADAVHAYASDIENVRYMLWGPNERKDTGEFIGECLRKEAETPRLAYDFAITLKSSGKLIGACGLYLNKEMTEGMLGWILHRDCWKRGYMPEAATALLRLGFEQLKLHRIYATCNVENYGSRRVMEKCGMRREAHFVKNRFGRVGTEKVWYDEYHYALLAEEWAKEKADIREVADAGEKARISRLVLEALPEWFGIPEAREDYIRGSRNAVFFAAFEAGAPAGFIALTAHNAHTAEVRVMGVLKPYHRKGIGAALVGKAAEYGRAAGYALLEVKTLDASRGNAEYAGTREFYEAVGFMPLECIPQIWGAENPCLVMVRPIR